MWNIESFGSPPGDARKLAASLRSTVSACELADSRLPDFVSLSVHFDKLCLPFRDHAVDSLSLRIFETLLEQGETRLIIADNPLYDDADQNVAAVDISDKALREMLIAESLFSGAYIIATSSGIFTWIGNFTDYGFMFTEASVIEAIFEVGALTAYCMQTCEFRLNYGGDALLDAEVRKLDKLWSGQIASH